jgi:hypothetical protein
MGNGESDVLVVVQEAIDPTACNLRLGPRIKTPDSWLLGMIPIFCNSCNSSHSSLPYPPFTPMVRETAAPRSRSLSSKVIIENQKFPREPPCLAQSKGSEPSWAPHGPSQIGKPKRLASNRPSLKQ